MAKNNLFLPRISLFPIDPPGHGRIGGHYIQTWCSYVHVRHKNNRVKTCYNANVNARKTKCDLQKTPWMKIMTIYWLGPGGSLWSHPNCFLLWYLMSQSHHPFLSMGRETEDIIELRSEIAEGGRGWWMRANLGSISITST